MFDLFKRKWAFLKESHRMPIALLLAGLQGLSCLNW